MSKRLEIGICLHCLEWSCAKESILSVLLVEQEAKSSLQEEEKREERERARICLFFEGKQVLGLSQTCS